MGGSSGGAARWRPTKRSASTYLEAYEALRFRTLKIGEEAWIDLPGFTLKGSAISDIRHAVNKIVRDGVTFHVLDPVRDAALWSQIQKIDADWRAAQGGVELRFSIGRLAALPDPAVRYTLALAADGTTVLAYCAFLPVAGIHGLARDAMRRASQAPNGTMEFLIARSLEYFRDHGFAWVSLGMAPLANVDTARGGILENALRKIYRSPAANATYRYQSLFFFKRKFNPQWRGGYLVYAGPLSLPAVLAAVVGVHVPGLGPRFVLRAARTQREARNLPATTQVGSSRV